MKRLHLLATWALLAASADAPAQDRATSLASLVDRAASVVTARCTARSRVPGQHVASFDLLQKVSGREIGARFQLSESSSVVCGSALHGVGSGRSYLLFLDQDGLLVGGFHGIEPLAPELLEHVELLAATPGEEARVRLLASALASRHARVRGDAALDLGFLPGLARHADASVRALLLTGLAADPLIREPATANLFLALRRLSEERAIEPIVDLFVGGRRPELDGFIKNGLKSFGDEAVAGAASARSPSSAPQRVRQVELLEDLAAPAASRALARLAADPEDSVRARALRAVLVRNEAPPAGAAPPEVEAARTALDRDVARPRKFRSISVPGEPARR